MGHVDRLDRRLLPFPLGDQNLAGIWSPGEVGLHSNNKELLAVVKAVAYFRVRLACQHIVICSDNTSTVAAINKQGGTKFWSLTELAWELWELLDGIHCVARARHIPGRLNVLADCLSQGHSIRMVHSASGSGEDLGEMGTPEVDLFATHHNYKIRKFVSPFPHPRAWRVNAFSLDWSGMFAYAFPPWVILQEVLQKLIDDRAKMILVAPTWLSTTWFPLLLQLSIEDPVPLPMTWNLLLQPHSGIHHQNLSVLNLQAWLLSGQR